MLKKVMKALLVSGIYFGWAILFYCLREGWRPIDAIYFAMVTMSTFRQARSGRQGVRRASTPVYVCMRVSEQLSLNAGRRDGSLISQSDTQTDRRRTGVRAGTGTDGVYGSWVLVCTGAVTLRS